MKTSTLICTTAIIVHAALYFDFTKGLFFGTLDILPFTLLTGLGGLTGLKFAIAMKLREHLEWTTIMRHRVGLRVSHENGKMPEPFVPEAPNPHYGIFGVSAKRAPLGRTPYFLGGHGERWITFKIPGSNFDILVDQSGTRYFSKVGSSSDSVDGKEMPFRLSSRNLKSPLVTVAAKEFAAKAKGAAEPDPNLVEGAPSLVREMDVDGCILRLSCEVGARPQSYGKYGRRVARSIASVGTVRESSSIYPYQAAFRKGKSSGFESCAGEYPKCKHDLKDFVAFINSRAPP